MALDRIEGGRAAEAARVVRCCFVQSQGQISPREYASCLKEALAMIRTNGLGQALAFLYAKGDLRRRVSLQLCGWLFARFPFLRQQGGQAGGNINAVNIDEREVEGFLNRLQSGGIGSSLYFDLTAEALAFLEWMSRFAAGLGEQPEPAQRGR